MLSGAPFTTLALFLAGARYCTRRGRIYIYLYKYLCVYKRRVSEALCTAKRVVFLLVGAGTRGAILRESCIMLRSGEAGRGVGVASCAVAAGLSDRGVAGEKEASDEQVAPKMDTDAAS